jgi:hypothetical protein
MNDTTESGETAQVQCPPTKDPAVRYLIFAGLALGLAIWCSLDRRPKPPAWDLEHLNKISNYLFNNWSPLVTAPLGLIAVFAAVRQFTRKLVADEEGITYGCQYVAWGDVKAIDAVRLKSKGILVLRCAEDSKLKLDSYNMHGFKELVAFIEKKLPDVERIEPEEKSAD